MGVNQQVLLSLGGAAAIDPSAAAFLAVTGIVDPTISSAINQLCISLKDFGIFTKCNAIYPFVGGTATTNKYNLVNPVDTDGGFRQTYTGGVTHTNGLLPNGTTGFADTHWAPTDHLSNGDEHLSICSNTNNVPPSVDSYDMGAYVGGSQCDFITLRNGVGTNVFGGGLNSNPASASSTNASAVGFFIVSATGGVAGPTATYKNGIAQAAGVSGAQANVNLVIGCIQLGGVTPYGFTNQNYTFVSMGSGLDATEAGDFNTAVQAFQTALGR